MINLSLDFESMAVRLQPLLRGWVDTVVPREVELVSNPGYKAAYAWMFSYERDLRDRIFGVLGRQVPVLERVFFGADGVASEGLSNAFVHGHQRDPERPIRVRCVVGETGVALAIMDSGPGFDIEATLKLMDQKREYFHQAGNGIRAFIGVENLTTSFSDGGRTLNLLLRFR